VGVKRPCLLSWYYLQTISAYNKALDLTAILLRSIVAGEDQTSCFKNFSRHPDFKSKIIFELSL